MDACQLQVRPISETRSKRPLAAVAQSVEHRIRNAGVGGSNPFGGTTFKTRSRVSSADIFAHRRHVRFGSFAAELDSQRAPFNVHEVVQALVLPPVQDLQALTHWFICLESYSVCSRAMHAAC